MSPNRSHDHGNDKATALHRLEEFGSPYASDTSWSAQPDEAQLTEMPPLALSVRYRVWMSRKAGRVDEPSPASMQRPVYHSRSTNPSYRGLAFHIASKSDYTRRVGKGYVRDYPGAFMVDHGVSLADWHRFLHDIEVAARLTKAQWIMVNLVWGLLWGPLGESLSL